MRFLPAEANFEASLLETVANRLFCRTADPSASFSLTDFRAPRLGRLRGGTISAVSGSANVPGPIDFLGGFGAGLLLKEFGGK